MVDFRKNLTESEEESLSRLQGWWNENGRYIIFGAILGFVGIGSWKGWQYWTEQHRITAAELFFEYRQELEKENDGAAMLELLELKYEDTPYPSLAYEQLAKNHIEGGKKQEAFDALDKAADLVHEPVRLVLISLRQARILLAMKKPREALRLADEFRSQPGMVSLAEELRGDALSQLGDFAGAKTAYQVALGNTRVRSDFLRMKLENLGE